MYPFKACSWPPKKQWMGEATSVEVIEEPIRPETSQPLIVLYVGWKIAWIEEQTIKCWHVFWGYGVTKTTLILVGVYVDDLLATSNNVKPVEKVFEQMKAFDLKDLGVAIKSRP